ncbi:MAG: PKD domain-containing protein [Planctomycetota bacterium]|nr:PKD domain-containing protein [Planctomycetota bacterium]
MPSFESLYGGTLTFETSTGHIEFMCHCDDGELKSEKLISFPVRSLDDNTAPHASMTGPEVAEAGREAVFRYTGPNVDDDGDPLSLHWMATPAESSSHGTDGYRTFRCVFKNTGTHVVRLSVSDPQGAETLAGMKVKVVESSEPPVAYATLPESVEVNQPLPLDSSASTDPEGASLTSTWRILTAADGAERPSDIIASTSQTPTLRFSEPGDYTISLTRE